MKSTQSVSKLDSRPTYRDLTREGFTVEHDSDVVVISRPEPFWYFHRRLKSIEDIQFSIKEAPRNPTTGRHQIMIAEASDPTDREVNYVFVSEETYEKLKLLHHKYVLAAQELSDAAADYKKLI